MNPRQFISMFSTLIQLTMLKDLFFFLPSYKYGHLKRNFFCGTNVEEDVENVAFPLFAGFCQDHSSRGLTQIILILQFAQYALGAIQYSSPAPNFTKLTGRSITRKTIFVCCSQQVVDGTFEDLSPWTIFRPRRDK